MKNKNVSNLIIAILIPLAVGTLSALFSGGMSPYSILNKPALSPPALLFPIVWTILYVLMGISSYLVYAAKIHPREGALKVYALQLFFNFFWSIIFFRAAQYLIAFFWLIALIILIVIMIFRFWKIDRIAAYLQIPYLLWCLFAAYLNFMVYQLN